MNEKSLRRDRLWGERSRLRHPSALAKFVECLGRNAVLPADLVARQLAGADRGPDGVSAEASDAHEIGDGFERCGGSGHAALPSTLPD